MKEFPKDATLEDETAGVGRYAHLKIVLATLADGQEACWTHNGLAYVHPEIGPSAREAYRARRQRFCNVWPF